MSDTIHHECGIAVIKLLKPLSYYVEKYKTPLYGINKLYILMEKQHNRGQDGAGVGVISYNVPPGNEYIYLKKSISNTPLQDIFSQIHAEYDKYSRKNPLVDIEEYKAALPFLGELLLGHLRYGTYGTNDIEACHPIYRKNNWKTKNLMIAGNFNMTNNAQLFERLIDLGQFPLNMSDTITVLEKIGHFLDRENEHLYQEYKLKGYSKREITEFISKKLSLEYILQKSARDFDGGYTIAGLIGNGDAFVLRDPSGIRPAFYYMDKEILVVASEKPAIRTTLNLPYQEIKEITPGCALIIKNDGSVKEQQILEPSIKRSCSFERIYFSRGTDEDIYKERKNLGKFLAPKVLKKINYDLENTVFSYIPNTAEVAFLGLIEGLDTYLNEQKKKKILELKNPDNNAIDNILNLKLRVEKIAVKDTQLRTFITDDKQRGDLVSHVYDTTYGLIKTGIDNLVVLDDSIVRGTTLKQSIINNLDRLHPKKIIIVSSAPQIRYPDCYGIDMSKLKDFVAFKAVIELLKEKKKDFLVREVYRKCKDQEKDDMDKISNYVKELYDPFSYDEVTDKIGEMLKTDDMFAELDIIYQDIDDLHKAIPNHKGDWYFTGNYPTPGGNKVVNQSFINYFEGKEQRSY